MNAMAGFARTKDAPALFEAAQGRKIAFGEVQSVAQVAANPQHEFRHFFRSVDWDGSEIRIPGPVARFHGTPAPAPGPPEPATTVTWEPRPRPESGGDDPRRDDLLREQSNKPLAGVRILDFTHVLAGPFAMRILGDLGADVIKLQTAERAQLVNDPSFPYFYVWNRSRRNVSLNMKDGRAVEVVRQLVENSDVVIENFSAGVLDRWGLSYEQVKDWNPQIIYLTMSGCGHEGPWSKLVTYAPTIHALCGLTYLSNPPGRGDVGPGFSLNDHAAGMSAAFAVLTALHDREGAGRGQHVDISQMETGAYILGPAVLDYLANGREAQPAGNADPFGQLCPNECYQTGDGEWLAITCRDDGDWARLLDATGLEGDAALETVEGRLGRRTQVDRLVGRWVATVTADEGQALLQAAAVPAGKIQNGEDLMADPQLVDRKMWGTFDHAVFGSRPFDRYPAIWSGTTLQPYMAAPAYIGEHNFEVYAEVAGLDEATVAEGISDGLFS
jgi:crotonobetainyl-CoA:carnitine CoA-transferase CaiB-like acyl-CoA transferase